MNAEIKDKWIKALTSGEFIQGQSGLRNKSNQFCCLGVLCELYRQEVGGCNWVDLELGENEFYGFVLDKDTNHENIVTGVPSTEVCEWAGLEQENPTPKGHNLSIAELNDKGYNFAALAELIKDKI